MSPGKKEDEGSNYSDGTTSGNARGLTNSCFLSDEALNEFGISDEVKQEVQALQAIYMNDFEVLQLDEADKKAGFAIKMKIMLAPMCDKVYKSLYFIISLPKDYPDVTLSFSLEKKKGLSDTQMQEIQDLVKAKIEQTEKETGVIYSITQEILEYLDKHNAPTLSFYDEMITRQKAEQEQKLKEKLQQEMKLKEEEKKAIEEEDHQGDNNEEAEEVIDDWMTVSHRNIESRDLSATEDSFSSFSSFSETNSGSINSPADSRRRQRSYTERPKSVHPPIDKWKLGEVISEGFHGKVYKGYGIDRANKSVYAIKELALPREWINFNIDTDLGVQSLLRLKHDHIVPYYAIKKQETTEATHNQFIYIFMEYFSGGSLEKFLASNPLQREETILSKYALQIINGLDYLHSQSIAHGNLKVSNLMLDQNLHIKLSGYGYHMLIDREGKGLYSNSFESQKKQDIYSLGKLILDIVTWGKKGSSENISLPPHLSRRMREFITLCMSKNPHKRPSISDLLNHPFVADVSETLHDFIPLSLDESFSMGTSVRKSDDTVSSKTKSLLSSQDSSVYAGWNQSRYKTDFEELEFLGRGGFGEVVKVRNRLDGRVYAIKKILLKSKGSLTDKVLREVTTLSRLNHEYVVRYYQAWIETCTDNPSRYKDDDEFEDDEDDEEDEDEEVEEDDEEEGEEDDEFNEVEESDNENERTHKDKNDWLSSRSNSLVFFDGDASSNDGDSSVQIDFLDEDSGDDPIPEKATKSAKVAKDNTPPQMLYIQMEYCTRKTLRNLIDERSIRDEDEIWRLFRQILEGLNHIHQQGIIHRDLKPANIFIDANDNIQIGDFGLATSGPEKEKPKPASKKHLSLSSDDAQSLTTGVGTPVYSSPEQLQGKHYDHKVDIYALGIIFFEMCHQFSTGMERIEILKSLREQAVVPKSFEENHPTKVELLKRMVAGDPEDRPTTTEILNSNYLPPKLEDEILKEALRTITMPNTTIFSHLMKRLFTVRPENSQIDFAYDMGRNKAIALSDALLRQSIFDKVSQLFKLHGAILLDSPLIVPSTTMQRLQPSEKIKNVVNLIDEAGTIVMLPFDQTLPFARYIAQNKITHLRRYTIAKVFRKDVARGQPREFYECDFDIVGPHSLRQVHDAEIIKVLCDLIQSFSSQLGSWQITINHSRFVYHVLELCDIDRKKHRDVCAILEAAWKYSWQQIGKQLVKTCGVSQKSVEALEPFFRAKGPVEQIIPKLPKLLANRDTQKTPPSEALSELQKTISYLKAFGVLDKIQFNLGLVHNIASYDGILFQAALLNKTSAVTDIIAAGGRYDKLIAEFQQTHASGSTGAVGVNIAIEKIIAYTINYEREQSKHEKKVRTSHFDVTICAFGNATVADNMIVATQLWGKGIRAEYIHTEGQQLDDLHLHCKQTGIKWMVILKSPLGTAPLRATVKLKNVDTNIETMVAVKDLADALMPKEVTSSTEMTSGHHHQESSPSTQPIRGQSTSSSPSLNVIVLDQSMRSKKKKQITSDVQRSVLPTLKGFAYCTTFTGIAVDMPWTIIKEITSSIDIVNDIQMHTFVSKHPRYRSSITELREVLNKIKADAKAAPMVFLYSYADNRWEALFFKKKD